MALKTFANWTGLILGALMFGFILYFTIRPYWFPYIRPFMFGPFISDPDAPRFDPKQFRFENYRDTFGNEWDLPKALIKMFPPRTDKAYIDSILVDRAGAGVSKNIHGPKDIDTNTYTYRWPSWASMGGELLAITFDEQMKSRSFFSGGVRYYEDRTFSDKFMIKHHEERAQHPSAGYRYVEEHMRPIRKQYLGVEDGILK